ncbi:MipA/OmpV family protein [Halobacteriovorax marinus]|uniref:MipA/OmpV family protein n=1 Tax=Halobacteriovorax marinus TaxID=97084 RepID=UPI003A932382
MKSLTILILLLTSSTIYSNEGKGYSFSLGGGVIYKQNIRDDNQYDKADKNSIVTPIPMAQLSIGPVSISGPNVKVKLPGTTFISPYIGIGRNGERYYGPGMEWRKDSWFAEVGANILMFKLSYSRDVQGRSHGEIMDISYNGRLFLGKVILNYTFSHTFYDKEFTNYYYGVRANEVTGDRPYYAPKSSGTNSVAISPIWLISKNVSWFNSVKATFLGSKIKDSPTVARDWYLTAISGITYKFD